MYPKRHRYLRLVLLALAMALGGAGETHAAETSLTPSIMLKEEYNDNVFFTNSAPQSSFISTASTALTFAGRSERISSRLQARLDGLLYSNDTDLNGLEQRYSAQAGYRPTPKAHLEASGEFSRQSRPDRYIATSGLVVTQDTSQQLYRLIGSAELNEKLTGSLGYNYDWADYHDPTSSNYHAHGVRGVLEHDLAKLLPNTKLYGSVGYQWFDYGSSTVQSGAARVGLSYRLHELWTVQADVGGRTTHAEFTSLAGTSSSGPAPTKRESDDAGVVATVNTFYHGERREASFTLSRELQNADGRSGAAVTTSAALQVSTKFTLEMSGELAASYHLNTSYGGTLAQQPINERTLTINPSFSYRFSPNLNAQMSYEYAQIRDLEEGTTSHRNSVFLSLTVRKPFFE